MSSKKRTTKNLKKMKRSYLILLSAALLGTSWGASAQQNPQYTQYMYNMEVVNPAYAGSKESLSIGLLYRNQWAGFDGAPTTYTFSAHSPIGEKTGLGVSAISDEYGPVKETNAYVDFSYTIGLGGATKLAFGIKAGATFQDIGLFHLGMDDSDPAFAQNTSNTTPNIGAGLLLYTDNYYIGVSVPNMLESVHLDYNGVEYGSEKRHFFATAGYVFQLGDNLKFKPSTLVKTAFGAPLSFDVNANFLFYDRFEIGASYRYEDAVSGLVSIRATDWVQLGFAYDYTISDIEEPSYEAFILFDIYFKTKTFRSPRYF